MNSQRQVLLDPVGSNIWNGSSPQTINSAAITWGAIGPLHMFGPGTDYYIILWAFLVNICTYKKEAQSLTLTKDWICFTSALLVPS